MKPGGHNYVCELTVAGSIDPVTGMVVNITDVDAVLKAQVVHLLDGVVLDSDIATFCATLPTPENIARFIWDACADRLPSTCRLHGVTLYWKPTGWVSIRKNRTAMLTVTRAYDFSASHRLHAPSLGDQENQAIFGKCNRVNGHGHNYEVEVTVAGDADPSTGRVISPDLLDRMVEEEVLTPFDHRHLNLDVPEFAETNPTSENLTRVIWDRLAARWGREPVSARLYRVTVRETARNYFDYYGPNADDGV